MQFKRVNNQERLQCKRSAVFRHAHAQLFAASFTWFSFLLRCLCHEVSFSHFLSPLPSPSSAYGLLHCYFSVWRVPVHFLLVWGLMAGLCRVVTARGALFNLGAGKGGSPWILPAPGLHLALLLLTLFKSKKMPQIFHVSTHELCTQQSLVLITW